MGSKDLRKSLMKLWEENPNCCWCGRRTTLEGRRNQKMLPHTATLEHLFSRFHPDRTKPPKNGERRRALACHECNNRRGAEEVASRLQPKRYTREQRLERFINSLSPVGVVG